MTLHKIQNGTVKMFIFYLLSLMFENNVGMLFLYKVIVIKVSTHMCLNIINKSDICVHSYKNVHYKSS